MLLLPPFYRWENWGNLWSPVSLAVSEGVQPQEWDFRSCSRLLGFVPSHWILWKKVVWGNQRQFHYSMSERYSFRFQTPGSKRQDYCVPSPMLVWGELQQNLTVATESISSQWHSRAASLRSFQLTYHRIGKSETYRHSDKPFLTPFSGG